MDGPTPDAATRVQNPTTATGVHPETQREETSSGYPDEPCILHSFPCTLGFHTGAGRRTGLLRVYTSSLPVGECRGLRCRTGLRKAVILSSVRVIQRGWCGASWRYSCLPMLHQWVIVLTSPFCKV